ncbi:MAG: hypothetical protein PUG48_00610 [Clostridia bacterium]|nr:hypothetical protein [Clostridia bacterium]
MKKFICIIASMILCTAAISGCGNSQTKTNESSVTTSKNSETSTVQSSVQSETNESSTDISVQSSEADEQSSEEIPEEISLPDGVIQTPTGNLQYKNSVLSLSVTFPSEFCMTDTAYTPPYGIYLKNTDGTATLQLESVEDKNVTVEDFAESLKNEASDGEVYITDAKDIVCKRTIIDRSNNEVMIFMKVRVKNGGYNEAVLYCKPDEREKYEKLFSKINFS